MNMVDLLVIFILSIAPVTEVRGGIPYVLLTQSDSYSRFIGILLSVVANSMVPLVAYPILDLLDYAMKSKYTPTLVKRLYKWILSFGRKKALGLKKASYIALALFVGVPLPATGAWTGTLVAYILGLDRRKSIIAIIAGVIIASVIVLAATYMGIELLKKLFLL